MPQPSEKLAESLAALQMLQERGVVAIRSKDLSRTHRERLRRNGFLQQITKGWYIPARPDGMVSESGAWYAAYWPFCSAYLTHRFDRAWCLSPEQSLLLHAGNWRVPRQLLVRAPAKARNNVTALPHGTSLLDVRTAIPPEQDLVEREGLRLFSLPAALVACGPTAFRQNPIDLRTALATVRDASEVLDRLLEGGHSTIAGRLTGAFRNIGRKRIADDILAAMRAAGYTVRVDNPFESEPVLVLPARQVSQHVNRIRLMWHAMRGPIAAEFPAPPSLPANKKAYLKRVEDAYVTDAYHSLSIEGYRVSPELIDRVRASNWNPEHDEDDREHRNALAARGYWQAHQAVRKSVERVLDGEDAGAVVDDDHGAWYRELFGPSVSAGIIRAADLAGYRNDTVFILGSMHVPPRVEAVRDGMPAYFDLLREETDPAVRAILGHFVFVYIHPYMDGNGRMGRFLMNVMLAAGGYPWTVIPVERRDAYMTALEAASVEQNISPFGEFLAELVSKGLAGRRPPRVPKA